MTPVQWQRAKELLSAVLEQPPGSRAAFLADLPLDDPVVHREVASLLAAHERSSSFIEMPAATPADIAERLAIDSPSSRFAPPTTTSPAGRFAEDLAVGQRIGPWQVLRPIATGGMGVVYLAARVDGVYEKHAALKLMRIDVLRRDAAWRDELLRRFHRERQTLANLDHPYIARLLDAGAADDGGPYLVMEYIEGVPIDRYCDENRLTITQRLELFVKVCEAVQYAHQNLLVHRDLKPGNILVIEEGVMRSATPKLLDFGIAKLLDPDSAAPAAELTQAGQPMTPAYASPEQVRRGTITTASDVYSLGVLLYELLTGRRPYRVNAAPLHEILRIICEQEPERPSIIVARSEPVDDGADRESAMITPQSVSRLREGHPDRLRRRLTGDLDTIVLKALRKEPERRYASVQELADDIRRHLNGRPVHARPDTWRYRATTFVRRHRLAVGVAASVAVTLVTGLVVMSRQAHTLAVQRDALETSLVQTRAAKERARTGALTAERVVEFLVGAFQAPDPFSAAGSVETRGTDVTAGEILAEAADRVEADLANDPLVQARLMDALGCVYMGLGAYREAESLLTQALETRKRIHGGSHPQVATSLHHIAELRFRQGDLQTARSMFGQALSLRRQLFPADHPSIARTMIALAEVLVRTGDFKQAEQLHADAVSIFGRRGGADNRDVAVATAVFADVMRGQGRFEQAESLQRKALDMLRRLHGEQHVDVAICKNALAAVLISAGRFDEALSLCREALDAQRALLPARHPTLARTLGNLGRALEETGEWADAEQCFQEALDIRRLLGCNHPEFADSLNHLGHLRSRQLRYAEALPLYSEALAIRRTLGETPDLALSLHNLGSVQMHLGRYDESRRHFDEALQLRRRLLEPNHPALASTLTWLGTLYLHLEDYAAARPALEEALRIRETRFSPEHPALAETINPLARVLIDSGEPEAALSLLQKALRVRYSTADRENTASIATLIHLGLALTRTDRAAEGEPYLREALQTCEARYPHHWSTASARSILGECLTAQQRYVEAEPILLDNYAKLREQRGDNDKSTREALRRIVQLYDAWPKADEAERYRAMLASVEHQAAPHTAPNNR